MFNELTGNLQPSTATSCFAYECSIGCNLYCNQACIPFDLPRALVRSDVLLTDLDALRISNS